MPFSLSKDIGSITGLKRHTQEIVDQPHRTGRPVVLTVNGRADSVLLKSAKLARLLVLAEAEAAAGQSRPALDFLH